MGTAGLFGGAGYRSPTMAMVVLPRYPTLQEAEDALSLALVALVLGTRPPVTTAIVRDQLVLHFGISVNQFTVHRTCPDDFIMRFSRAANLERVLVTPWPTRGPLRLVLAEVEPSVHDIIWCILFPCPRWHEGHPSSRSLLTAQHFMGSSSAGVEIASPEAIDDPDNERKLFITA